MSTIRSRGEQVRTFILENLPKHPSDIVRVTVAKFGISRQAANRHLQNLIREKAVVPEGKTRNRVYRLANLAQWERWFPVDASLSEDVAWHLVSPELGPLPGNVRSLWQYGFTEMFNNAIDHSGAQAILVRIQKTAARTEMVIMDTGVGIFRKIRAALGLEDERHSVLELAKGKFTTDPQRHSGEGIFFTSRIFDRFQILSGNVYYAHDFGDEEDWILGRDDSTDGTFVRMSLNNHTARNLRAVFDEYSDADLTFSKTVVPVRLVQIGGDNLVSRSQAKRLLARVDRFKTVMLDFKGVETIGQAFADETFRVFQREHPAVELVPINANADVLAMITRAQATAPAPLNIAVTSEMAAVIEAAKAPRNKIAQANADLDAGRLSPMEFDKVLASEGATQDQLNRQWHDLFVQEVRRQHPGFSGAVNVPLMPTEWPPPLPTVGS